MAHIKLVPGHKITHKEKEALDKFGLKGVEDVCLVRGSASGFESLLTQIPVAAVSGYLEWQVFVEQMKQDKSSVKHFAVCFCYGPECFQEVQTLDPEGKLVLRRKYRERDPLSWYTAGHVSVHYTDLASSSEGPNGNWYTSRNMLPEKSCGEQWRYGDYLAMAGVVAQRREHNMVRFSCDKNFIDMQGPTWLKCVDGLWFEEPNELLKEKTETLKRWDWKLPYCRWKFSSCDPGRLGKLELANGAVSVMNGVARYACYADFQLVAGVGVDAKPVGAASYVKWCTEDGSWEPLEQVACESRILNSVARMPGTEPAETILAQKQRFSQMPMASFLELSHDEVSHNATDGEAIPAETAPGDNHATVSNTSFLELGESSTKEAIADDQVINDTMPTASSFVELGANAQQRQATAQKVQQRSSTQSSRDGVETGRRLKMKVREFAKEAEQDARWSMAPPRGVLQIHPWPIAFTTDPSHTFQVDTCYFTAGCTFGRTRLDTIDSPLFVYRPPARQRSTPWSVITAAAASIIVSLAAMVMITKRKKSDPQA
jgi:hypothetical protein